MTLALEKGVSVLICTYNGGRIISKTLEHLEKQRFTHKIPWEIIIVDNGSTDETSGEIEELVVSLRNIVPVQLAYEPKKGKENAVDKGLRISAYKYVIICDDDNWLSNNYVEYAFKIMESNPSIGLLGGKGIAVIEGTIPNWFNTYKSFFAVGEQHYLNGEIRHFWPKYKFIWGAGSVINKSAYNILLNSGFKRILTYEGAGKVSRSEDLELCFAIWLTDFKMWYDDNLTYHHYITQDRLTDEYLLKIIKISTSAIYYLRPYNILKFTGSAFCPKRGFWYKNILASFQAVVGKANWRYELALSVKIMTAKKIVNPVHIYKLMSIMQFLVALRLAYRYEVNFKKVCRLKKNIELQLLNQKEFHGRN